MLAITVALSLGTGLKGGHLNVSGPHCLVYLSPASLSPSVLPKLKKPVSADWSWELILACSASCGVEVALISCVSNSFIFYKLEKDVHLQFKMNDLNNIAAP